METLITQGLGFLAAFFNISKHQFKNLRYIRLFTMFAAIAFVIHYWLMDAHLASQLCVLAVIRSGLLSTDWGMKYRKIIAGLTVSASLILGILFADSILSWMAVMGLISHTIAEIQTRSLNMRVLMFVAPSLWLVFNAIIGSYGPMISSAFSVCSNIIGIYRHHYRPYQQKKRT